MSNIQPLDNIAHADLKIDLSHSPQLGSATNQVQILVTEFEEAQRHYPILFTKDENGKLLAMAVLGFDKDENLFVADGRWDGYAPAVMRRGPFLIGNSNSDEPAIAIDLEHPRVRIADEEGLPLFLDQGGHAPALEASLNALRAIHVGTQHGEALQECFEEAGLLEDANIQVRLDSEKHMNFEGYLVVTHERIAALETPALEKLHKAGFLQPAVFAASSIHNVQRLILRKRTRELT